MEKIAKVSLSRIKTLVEDDYNVIIDDEVAQQIKDAAANGTLVWTAQHLITTNGIRITPNDDRLPRQY